MSTVKAKKAPTKEQIIWMLGIKTTRKLCPDTTDRIRAARKEFIKPTEYMLKQQRSIAAIMHQPVGQPLQHCQFRHGN